MGSKKIIFKSIEKIADSFGTNIYPSTTQLPDWFKTTKPYSTGSEDYFDLLKISKTSLRFETTFKRCIPVQDAMTSGYMITLPVTIFVTQRGGNPFIDWKTDWEPLDDVVKPPAMVNYPVPVGYSPTVFRWHTTHRVVTPKGYSVFLTHPNHRNDLPFFTIPAILDLDNHPNGVLMPFFIREGFEGFIEEGTPIAQILPFKREKWNSEVLPFEEEATNGLEMIKKSYERGYKKKFWSKKQYL